MGIYTQQSLGIQAPAGGFRDLGWYPGVNGGSYQYYQGSFGENGALHPNSPQPGAGQPVSREVVAQTNPKNVTYLEKSGAPLPSVTQPQQNAIMAERTAYGNPSSSNIPTISKPSVPDLMSTWDNLINTPEIKEAQSKADEIQSEIDARNKRRDEVIAEYRNDPFYSESSTVGKIAEVNALADRDIKTLLKEQQVYLDKITTAKTNAETKLNLNLKQYDINNTAYQQSLTRLNTLLSMGALNNAGAQDIADISSQTGISPTMIEGIIKTSKTKNLSLQSYDDGTNQYIAAVDSEGNVVNRQVLGRSKTGGSGKQNLSSALQLMTPAITRTLNSYGNISPQDWQKALADWLSQGLLYSDFIANYGQYADTNRGDFLQAYGFANPKKQLTPEQVKANNDAANLGKPLPYPT